MTKQKSKSNLHKSISFRWKIDLTGSCDNHNRVSSRHLFCPAKLFLSSNKQILPGRVFSPPLSVNRFANLFPSQSSRYATSTSTLLLLSNATSIVLQTQSSFLVSNATRARYPTQFLRQI